jgi:DNA polymerase/3'-5' exonuclease PolX
MSRRDGVETAIPALAQTKRDMNVESGKFRFHSYNSQQNLLSNVQENILFHIQDDKNKGLQPLVPSLFATQS